MLDNIFVCLKKTAENNKDKLPKLEDFPITEGSILLLYRQTYIITLIGLPTASLVMQGVLMESFVKYLYFHHKREDFEGNLYHLIKKCYFNNFFSKDDKRNKEYYNFFDKFRDSVRNIQIHFLSKEQTKGFGVRGMPINVPRDSNGGINKKAFLNNIADAQRNFTKKSETLWTDENPFVADTLKFKMDSETYLKQFCELTRVINMLNKEHNLDRKQKKKEVTSI